MANVDPIATLATWLRLQGVGVEPARIYDHEFPDGTFTYMPRSAVVLGMAGGPGDASLLNLARQRVDVRVYGTKLRTAHVLYASVHQALKHLARVIVDGALLHSVVLEGGPVGTREPDTGWPVVFASYQLLYAERT